MVRARQLRWKDNPHAKVRVLQGSIAFLLDELVGMLLEEGGHCSGPLRRQLATEFDTLRICLRELRHQASASDGLPSDGLPPQAPDVESPRTLYSPEPFHFDCLEYLCEEVNDQGLTLAQLLEIQAKFRRLIHQGSHPAIP